MRRLPQKRRRKQDLRLTRRRGPKPVRKMKTVSIEEEKQGNGKISGTSLAAFGPDAGLPEEAACRITANFGSGMKMGETCGAVTGGLMALGLYGIEEGATVGGFCRAVRENHSGCLNCRDLLRMNREAGRPQKPHCDDMVYECTALVEQILQEKK